MPGRHVAVGASPDDLRRAVNGALGDANVAQRGLTFGKVAHGEDAGRLDAVYAKIVLKAGVQEYTVPHTLGHVPGFVKLWASRNTTTPASHYDVIGWQHEKWTASSIRVRVRVSEGNLAGGEITLMIGGE